MHVAQLTAYHVRLPLKRPFSHASHVRRESENLVICCRLADGTTGWGEGVPRDYVTGESPATCFQQLAATPLADQLSLDCRDWSDVIALCDQVRPVISGNDSRGNGGNAFRCAIELSLLDAYGRLFGQPVGSVVDHFPPAAAIRGHAQEVRYSTVIGSDRRLRIKALKMRLYGFRQCKIKVGAEGCDDVSRLRCIRRWIGRDVDIRLDANEAWEAKNVPAKLEPLQLFHLSSVEQPCPHVQLAELSDVKQQLGVPVMLDESLTSQTDAERAIELEACDLFNIRLSKCGGFLESLRLAALASNAGLGYQLGCHPGESGILSAAGRHWATSVARVRYLEGSYDHHLLDQLITNEDLTFGYGGRAPALTTPGLGITINASVLRKVTEREESLRML